MNQLGLHILLTLEVLDQEKLISLDDFILYTQNLLIYYNLEEVGFTSHIFDNGGYTSAFCLKESHICIHTWPELKTLTLDIYLCDYTQNNNQKVRNISEKYICFFQGKIITKHEIFR